MGFFSYFTTTPSGALTLFRLYYLLPALFTWYLFGVKTIEALSPNSLPQPPSQNLWFWEGYGGDDESWEIWNIWLIL